MQSISKDTGSGDTSMAETKNSIHSHTMIGQYHKKKVAIITMFHGSTNYGGVLQAYALQKIITDLGFSCEQLRYSNTSEIPESSVIRSKKRLISIINDIKSGKKDNKFFIKIFRRFIVCLLLIYRIPFKILYLNKKKQIRKNNFISFNKRNIPSSKIYNNDTISASLQDYDIFVCGSDQIWNPSWYTKAYFLSFVPDACLKIAYAASIGVDTLSEEQIAFMQPLINRIQHISVREEKAKELLHDFTDKEVEWVLDPTLLLTSEEWNRVASTEKIDTPYVLTYLLGNNKANRACASSFAKKMGMKLVTLPFVGSSDMGQIFFGDIHSYGGPDSFIALIRDAEYVITDSFHGMVFSILFHKKFVVLKRTSDEHQGSMNSRLYSLLKILHMESQIIDSFTPDFDQIINSINYTPVNIILEEWRTRSKAYLIRSLSNSEPADMN